MITPAIRVIFRRGVVATADHVRDERCRAGEMDLENGRGRRQSDDLPDRRHGFLRAEGSALVARQIHLHICGFAVGTFYAHRCESISPQQPGMCSTCRGSSRSLRINSR